MSEELKVMYNELFHVLNDGSFEENVAAIKAQLDADLRDYRRFWGNDGNE